MTADKPTPVVPNLRFPEFQRVGDWKRDQIGNVASITKGKGLSKADITEGGAIPCIRYAELYTRYGEVIHEVVSRTNVPHEDLMLSQAEDVIVPASGETRADIARAACVLLERVALGSDLNILRSDLYGPFFSYLLNSPLRHTIAQVAQGDTVAHLYPKQLSLVWLAYPLRPEQQKIADCLGSLDDLIAAEGWKLESLRQHKQGLMQQLFPQPGETQPRLRFPEFQDTQEWRVAPLGKLFETTTGGTPDRARPDYWGGEVPWVTTSIVDFNVIESTKESISSAGLSNSSAKVFPKRTVLMALYGQGKTRGKVAMLGVEAATNQACAAILPSDEVDPRFVFLNLSGRYEEIRANSNSGGQKNLSQALVRDLPFAYPKERAEQHRIAECLTALDDQIAAQARKLETLKQHKRGLLQQLFPKPETA